MTYRSRHALEQVAFTGCKDSADKGLRRVHLGYVATFLGKNGNRWLFTLWYPVLSSMHICTVDVDLIPNTEFRKCPLPDPVRMDHIVRIPPQHSISPECDIRSTRH
jgi:hypothetical protein